MKAEKIDSVEVEPKWIYVPSERFIDKVIVIEIDIKKDEWQLLINDTLYSGTYEEILKKCIEYVSEKQKEIA